MFGSAVEDGRQRGDTDSAAQIAQDVVQAGGRTRLGRRDHRGSKDRHGHQDHGLAESAENLDGDELVTCKIQIQAATEETGESEQKEAGSADQARIDELHQDRHHRDDQQLRKAHPHDHLANLQGVVILYLRQING